MGGGKGRVARVKAVELESARGGVNRAQATSATAIAMRCFAAWMVHAKHCMLLHARAKQDRVETQTLLTSCIAAHGLGGEGGQGTLLRLHSKALLQKSGTCAVSIFTIRQADHADTQTWLGLHCELVGRRGQPWVCTASQGVYCRDKHM